MTTNKEAAAVIAEMRARKVNHGKSASPTLLTWADRFELALSVSADPGDVLVHCSGKEIAGRIGFSNANAPPASCNPTTQPASVPDRRARAIQSIISEVESHGLKLGVDDNPEPRT